MRLFISALLLLCALSFTGCNTPVPTSTTPPGASTGVPKLPTLPIEQLKPVLHAGVLIAQVLGYITPADGAVGNTVIDAMTGNIITDAPTLFATLQSTGKLNAIDAAKLAKINTIIQSLSVLGLGGIPGIPAAAPTPIATATPTP